MSKKKLSETAMVERAYISGLEAGKWNVSLNILFFLSEALGLDPRDFLTQVIEEIDKFQQKSPKI